MKYAISGAANPKIIKIGYRVHCISRLGSEARCPCGTIGGSSNCCVITTSNPEVISKGNGEDGCIPEA
jgi:hypothetical protein